MSRGEKVYFVIVAISLMLFILFAGFVQYQLGSNRQQFEQSRVELEEYESRYDDIREIVARTRENISGSCDTITELRGQIRQVREAFEDMEKLLYRDINAVNSDDGDTDTGEEMKP